MIQVFDVDRSLSVLGTKKDVREIFGSDPVTLQSEFKIELQNRKGEVLTRTGMNEHLKLYLGKLFKKEKVTVKDDFFGIETEDIVTRPTELAQKVGLRGILVDSVSGLGEAVRNDIMAEENVKMMTRDAWGKYGVRISNLLTALRDIPTIVILTCHIDRTENEDGIVIEYPAIKGSQKTDALRWFDVIVYHSVVDGEIKWQVQKDPQRPFIRSRAVIPEWGNEKYVDPDFMPVLRAYHKATTPLKMMVCGDSGSGKTTATKTIADYVKAFKKKSSKSASAGCSDGSPKSRKDSDASVKSAGGQSAADGDAGNSAPTTRQGTADAEE